MLCIHTIRRKLLLGVGLVLGMLLILSVSGIWGLSAYSGVIRRLDYEITQAPQRNELVNAAAALFEPLDWGVYNADDAQLQRERLLELLTEAENRVLEFGRRKDAFPPTTLWMSQRPITESRMLQYGECLENMRRLAETLGRAKPPGQTAEPREVLIGELKDKTAELLKIALAIPDPVEGTSDSLAEARRVQRSSLTAVWIASAIVLVLFVGLLRSGYVWIFDPIRKLHQGARRVALGDFNYRVRLATRDEMAELADAFNMMTSRFQEIAGDLDRQVQERSRQLVRSERLAGVGFLAAGVAHEINNPLSAIAMAAESLEGRVLDIVGALEPADAAVVRQYLRMIQDESFRCREITERLLDFARGREAARESTDVARLVSEVVAMVQYLSKYREKKIVFENCGPCYAEVNGPEIKQVVLNLVANGLDAVDRGGTLQITLTEQTDQLAIDFVDNGCGMTAEVIERLFEPFFTRKQSGQGTGLGLSISHRIISQHGGTISVTSAGPGLGSTFTVRLPRRAVSQPAAA